ncbi:hypothetical protein GMST_13030 [Geomonas silvestris]|uniref:DUF350 domain-containing protein n=1 Tax=Geomonas silvestris TaxID=2740184 RepID=A0A6V8MG61_9BACT|nr:DUF350 domain-containing protein [Geomonas silvestris]GFO58978.1 hypothetical protein GMST_13030 [Geomonas silvestris]
MFFLRLLVSFFELGLMIVLSGLIIYVIYRVFIKANPEFDMEEEIIRGNPAVGILVSGIMVSAALMLRKGVGASVGMFRLSISAPADVAFPLWQTALLTLGHLVITLFFAIFTISLTLRLFGRMVNKLNPALRLGEQVRQGNLAVGILLAAVVFIATLYVGEGVSALTKALVPQPRIGTIQIME